MRFAASFIGAGLFDRYPRLRMGVLECGFGWLPFWARRMDEQAIYVGGTAPLKMKPSEYMMSGRFFCSIEHHEGEDMFDYVTRFLGDDLLMYASDYPHSECQFPNRFEHPRLVEPWRGTAAQAAVGEPQPVLQAELTTFGLHHHSVKNRNKAEHKQEQHCPQEAVDDVEQERRQNIDVSYQVAK